MMTANANARRWSMTLVAGAGALTVVAGLLEALRRAVSDLDEDVQHLWRSGQSLASNTQAAHLLGATRAQTAGLRDRPGGDGSTDDRRGGDKGRGR